MKNLQSVFSRIQELKKEQKEIRTVYKDALKNSNEYQNILEKIDALKTRKKEIEDGIKDDLKSSFEKLENLKYDIASENELMSDIALNQLVKGESISITDQYENQYEPIFSVRFKKM